jgi:hypothetical protein
MTDMLLVLLCVAVAASGLHGRRKRLARPDVVDPVEKIEWFTRQRRDRPSTEVGS